MTSYWYGRKVESKGENDWTGKQVATIILFPLFFYLFLSAWFY